MAARSVLNGEPLHDHYKIFRTFVLHFPVVCAMSGGVDSSVAAHLLKRQARSAIISRKFPSRSHFASNDRAIASMAFSCATGASRRPSTRRGPISAPIARTCSGATCSAFADTWPSPVRRCAVFKSYDWSYAYIILDRWTSAGIIGRTCSSRF